MASTIANYWADRGAEVVVVMLNHDQGVFYPIGETVIIERLSYGKHKNTLGQLYDFFSTVIRLRRLLTRYQITHQISFLPHVNVIAILAGFGSSRYVVLSERNDVSRQQLSTLWRAIRCLLYRFANLVTVNHRANIDRLRVCVPEHKLRWLPNPVDVGRFLQIKRNPQKRVLAVGRLAKQKGFDTLIRAFDLTDCKNHGWRLVIVGEGEERQELLRIIEECRLAQMVQIKNVSENIARELGEAGVLVVCSRYEGLPNILVEGMVLGAPPIVTEGVGDLARSLRKISPEIVTPVDSPDALAKAIDRLAADSVERTRIGNQVKALALPFHSTQAMREWNALIASTKK